MQHISVPVLLDLAGNVHVKYRQLGYHVLAENTKRLLGSATQR